jgi:hypothetical protein
MLQKCSWRRGIIPLSDAMRLKLRKLAETAFSNSLISRFSRRRRILIVTALREQLPKKMTHPFTADQERTGIKIGADEI